MLLFLRIALYVIVGFALFSWLWPAHRRRADEIMRITAGVLLASAAIFFVLHFLHFGV